MTTRPRGGAARAVDHSNENRRCVRLQAQRLCSGNDLLQTGVGGHSTCSKVTAATVRIGPASQMLRDDKSWRHEPLRLTVAIDAPAQRSSGNRRPRGELLGVEQADQINAVVQGMTRPGVVSRAHAGCSIHESADISGHDGPDNWLDLGYSHGRWSGDARPAGVRRAFRAPCQASDTCRSTPPTARCHQSRCFGLRAQDGFTRYPFFGGSRAARWGDYSAAVADADGSIWFANEYISNSPRTVLANWRTFIGNIFP